jgi:hypothetical protein
MPRYNPGYTPPPAPENEHRFGFWMVIALLASTIGIGMLMALFTSCGNYAPGEGPAACHTAG